MNEIEGQSKRCKSSASVKENVLSSENSNVTDCNDEQNTSATISNMSSEDQLPPNTITTSTQTESTHANTSEKEARVETVGRSPYKDTIYGGIMKG